MLAATLWGCAGDTRGDGIPASVNQSLSAPGPFLYLRCGTTSWGLTKASRLERTERAGVFAISLNVREPWMMSSGDTCILTESFVEDSFEGGAAFFGTRDPIVVAPQSSLLREPSAGEGTANEQELTFNVRFPRLGRFRALVDWNRKALSVTSEDSTRSGDVTWAWPDRAVMDGQNNVFAIEEQRAHGFSLVDRTTGLPRWTHATSSWVSLDTTCSDGETIVTSVGSTVEATDISTGSTRWSAAFAAAEDDYALPRCPTSNTVYVLHGHGNVRKLSAIHRKSGHLLWTYTADGAFAFFGENSGSAVLAEGQTLIALDAATGNLRWTRTSDESVYPQTVPETNDILFRSNGNLIALSAANGLEQWRHNETGDRLWANVDGAHLTIVGPASFERIDPRTGAIQWTHASSASRPSPYVLSNGATLVHDGTSLTMLDGQTGSVTWVRTEREANFDIYEDELHALYLMTKYEISRVDSRSGTSVWSRRYAFPGLPPTEVSWDPRGFLRVAASDAHSLFVLYNGPGFTGAPPQGIVAFDSATGALRWDHWTGRSITFIGQDSERLLVNTFANGNIARHESILK
jgi:outer membrane protein assembly factor BamB